VRFDAAELGEPRFFLAIVPSGSEPIQNVLILNHGWADRPEDLLRHLKADTVYADLLARHQVSRAIIVLPDVRFPNEFRRLADAYPFNHSLVLVAEEAAGVVSRYYRVPWDRERWSIGGFSFGGYVALDVVRRYPGRFSRAGVISGFYDEAWTFWPVMPPAPGKLDDLGRGRQTVVIPGPVPRLMLACGTEDRFYADMVKLHSRLHDSGIPATWMTSKGGHSWAYWSSVLRPLFTFLLPPDNRAPAALRDGVEE
jgi:enterochelin esterase-like enzyme